MEDRMKKQLVYLLMLVAAAVLLVACGGNQPTATDTSPQVDAPVAEAADLAAVKAYAVDQAAQMAAATARFRAGAEQYHAAVAHAAAEHPDENAYENLWAEHPNDMRALVAQMRADWLEASLHYELNEGIVAGVPSLAYYDAWIDAGPPATDDPKEAVAWQLVLADGTTLDSPGNFFHNLTEPTLYGTMADYAALEVDLDGDGAVGVGEVLPEAELLLAAAQGLDMATGDLVTAVDAWQPTLEDAFMALVTMIPTMNEYFEQWKLSSYIQGDEFQESAFIAVSRLSDINSILTGLDVTYDKVRPVVQGADADLDTQIDAGFVDLVGYVSDLYAQEQAGTVFAPEEADAFGTEAQNKATALAALVAQAAAKANVALDMEAAGWAPDTPPRIVAVAPEPAGFSD
jgi:iron uptake system EfeUOB component EfeO/EfeM